MKSDCIKDDARKPPHMKLYLPRASITSTKTAVVSCCIFQQHMCRHLLRPAADRWSTHTACRAARDGSDVYSTSEAGLGLLPTAIGSSAVLLLHGNEMAALWCAAQGFNGPSERKRSFPACCFALAGLCLLLQQNTSTPHSHFCNTVSTICRYGAQCIVRFPIRSVD